jgi:FkbM family methyltransferase
MTFTWPSMAKPELWSLIEFANDLHQIRWRDGLLWGVSGRCPELWAADPARRERVGAVSLSDLVPDSLRHAAPPARPDDRYHFNSLHFHGNRLWVLAHNWDHGSFAMELEYRDSFALLRRPRVLRVLPNLGNASHDVFPESNRVWVLDGEGGRLLGSDKQAIPITDPAGEIRLFPRGLAVGRDVLVVASGENNADRSIRMLGRTFLSVVDRRTLQMLTTIELGPYSNSCDLLLVSESDATDAPAPTLVTSLHRPPRQGERTTAVGRALPVSPSEQRRVRMTLQCGDSDAIPKVPGAGGIFTGLDRRYQLMHNGVRILEGCYGGRWTTEIIRSSRGHHEPQEEKVFHALLPHVRPGGVMLELGSFWGYYSLWFHREVPSGHNYLIEPDPHNLEIGKRNFEINHARGRFFQFSIGRDSAGPQPFHCESDGLTRPVPRISVDDFATRVGVPGIDLLLADIQGADLDMLEGAVGLIASGRLRFVVLSTHHHSISNDPLTHQKCLEFICRKGGHLIAWHNVVESYSGDGLIVASFLPEDRSIPQVGVSKNHPTNSCFRELEYDLAEAREQQELLEQLTANRGHLITVQTKLIEDQQQLLAGQRQQLDGQANQIGLMQCEREMERLQADAALRARLEEISELRCQLDRIQGLGSSSLAIARTVHAISVRHPRISNPIKRILSRMRGIATRAA